MQTSKTNWIGFSAALALLGMTSAVYGATPPTATQKRVLASAEVLNDILHAKDHGIPEDLVRKAECVGVVPSLKRAGLVRRVQKAVEMKTAFPRAVTRR